ncbi:hypothetical protein K402DRAFT_455480 [Aulographum hederae CBS 113979]|uniref:Lytic polysaccharide monooxygenase n=1 Tax=Aulographum hederae CBS 113979 TaxID=1176131 RepID=A0A6G1GVQ1_9PEZI|nr:hypothetical protein K402DRAFT_455480 [Aulographum hederae CBS 113979]
MAGLGAELGLGLVFTAISLAPFVPDWINAAKGERTQVLIGTGLPVVQANEDKNEMYDEYSFGGSTPNVALFGANGDRIGNSYNGRVNENKIEHESSRKIQVESWNKNNAATPEYMTISASSADTVCITHVVVTSAQTEETYAIVPGMVAQECNKVGKNYPWYPSSRSVQMRNPQTGSSDPIQLNCLMIGQPLNGRTEFPKVRVPFEGFSAHLYDFKLDNTKWEQWSEDNTQMCNSEARFTMWTNINEMQCPPVFQPAPPAGERIPYPTTIPCHPSMEFTDPHKDPALTFDEAKDIYHKSGRNDPAERDQFFEHSNIPPRPPGPPDSRPGEAPKSDPNWQPPINAGCRKRDPRCRRNAPEWLPHPHRNGTRSRTLPFHEQLVKSDIAVHSAAEVCGDEWTIGPDFYSVREGLFCDMVTKTLYPVCKGKGDVECFDEGTDRTRHGDRLHPRNFVADYGFVHKW